jgi:hypothetical protein
MVGLTVRVEGRLSFFITWWSASLHPILIFLYNEDVDGGLGGISGGT